jgi:hypothetical protein
MVETFIYDMVGGNGERISDIRWDRPVRNQVNELKRPRWKVWFGNRKMKSWLLSPESNE